MDLNVGDQVFLKDPLPYLKTADSIPVLRPPELVPPDEPGQIVEIRARGLFCVRFRRGTFLIPDDRLKTRIEEQ